MLPYSPRERVALTGRMKGSAATISWTEPLGGRWAYGDGAPGRRGGEARRQCEAALGVPDGTERAPFLMEGPASAGAFGGPTTGVDIGVRSPRRCGRELWESTEAPEERRGTFEDLDAGEHGLLACRAEAGWDGKELVDELIGTGRRSGQWIRMIHRGLEGEPATREHTPPAAVSEQPVVANPDKPARQDVQEKASSELGQRELLMPDTARAVVLEAKAHPLVVEGDEPMVGDGDAVGVTGQVGETETGPSKGGLAKTTQGFWRQRVTRSSRAAWDVWPSRP